MEAKPTDNPDAYVLYLRARDYQTRPIPLKEDNDTAAKLYTEAIALDPKFALAHARLSATLAYSHFYFTPTEEIARRARAEADEALRLRPDLGEGHLARALCFYWTQKDYESALRELENAARFRLTTSRWKAFAATSVDVRVDGVKRLAALEQSFTRDPRNGQIAGELFATRYAMRNWPEAARAGERAMAVALNLPTLRVNRGYIDFWARGDLATDPNRARLLCQPGLDPDGSVTLARWDVALLAGDFAAAERAVHESTVEAPRTVFGTPFPKSYLLGCVALARGDAPAAQRLFEAARPRDGSRSRGRAARRVPARTSRPALRVSRAGTKMRCAKDKRLSS